MTTTFVSPFFRRLVVVLLGGMAFIGQAPAWLHVGCEGHGRPMVSETAPQVAAESACSHSCSHRSQNEDADASSEKKSPLQGDDHDSDSCALCQSLALPNGVCVWQGNSAVCHDATEWVQLASTISPRTVPGILPKPRGPPAFDA